MTGQSPTDSAALPGTHARLARLLCVVLIVSGAAYAFELPALLGAPLLGMQFLGFALGLVLAIVFLTRPAIRGAPRPRLPWYDAFLAAAGATCGAYVAVRYPHIANEIRFPETGRVVLGSIAVLLVLEACRRIYGWLLPAIALAFLAYAVFADHAPGALATRGIPWERLVGELYFGTNGIHGVALRIVATVVLVFVLFGQLLFSMGGGNLFTELAAALLGRFRGGPAKIAVLGSALFGSISGSAVANVVITGTVTIPMMKRQGYKPEVAGAVEATASTGGLVMPPVMGAVAFIMADFLETSYGAIVIAAVIPAILYYAAILIQVDLIAGEQGMKGLPAEDIPRVGGVLARGWPYLLPLLVLIVLLVAFNWDPARAGMASVIVLLAVGGWFVRDWPARRWYGVLADAGEGTVEVIAVSALVGLIIAAADKTGLGFTMALPLLELGQSNLMLALAATALISMVLGMGLPGIAIYMMQVALFVPALTKLGIEPIAAHFFVMYFGTFSMLTPPVCISAFAAAAIAGASPMRTGWESCKLGIVAFVLPFVFALSPSLLGRGDPWLVALNFATALAGVFAVSVALRGFLLRRVGVPARLAYGAAALGLALPTEIFPGALSVNLVSLALAAGLIAAHVFSRPQPIVEGTRGA